MPIQNCGIILDSASWCTEPKILTSQPLQKKFATSGTNHPRCTQNMSVPVLMNGTTIRPAAQAEPRHQPRPGTPESSLAPHREGTSPILRTARTFSTQPEGPTQHATLGRSLPFYCPLWPLKERRHSLWSLTSDLAPWPTQHTPSVDDKRASHRKA